MIKVENRYHKLAKVKEENGQFKTKAAIGVEVEEKYGFFTTGEYVVGNTNKDDYRARITLKAVF